MFSVDITPEEIEKLKDPSGDIRFHKVLQWCLPRFGEDDDQILWDWQAERMNNYMAYIVKDKEYKPRYYTHGVIITGNPICRFYGIMLGRSLCGGKAINDV